MGLCGDSLMDIGQFWRRIPDNSIWYVMCRAWSYHEGNVWILENQVTKQIQTIRTLPSSLQYVLIGDIKHNENIRETS